MAKAPKLTYEQIIAGAQVGVDKNNRVLKFGDIVMFTSDNKGRSEIVFSQVLCKRGAYIQVTSMGNNQLTDSLHNVLENKGWFIGLASSSMTKVSKTFYEMWQSKDLFNI